MAYRRRWLGCATISLCRHPRERTGLLPSPRRRLASRPRPCAGATSRRCRRRTDRRSRIHLGRSRRIGNPGRDHLTWPDRPIARPTSTLQSKSWSKPGGSCRLLDEMQILVALWCRRRVGASIRIVGDDRRRPREKKVVAFAARMVALSGDVRAHRALIVVEASNLERDGVGDGGIVSKVGVGHRGRRAAVHCQRGRR